NTPKTTISRRDLLRGRMASPELLFRPEAGPRGDVLVCLFLRGGMDGLYVVPPFGDASYYRQRQTPAGGRPRRGARAGGGGGVGLASFFGLHPGLGPLQEAYQARHLAIIHACGTPDSSRSHFEAMETMERGVDDGSQASTGWLGRHLGTLDTGNHSPLRAI